MDMNIMMDPRPIFPKMYHPHALERNRDYQGFAPVTNRTRNPVKYYFIDFGLSRRYDVDNTSPREKPIWGGDKTVPEFQGSNDPVDPFPTDIYYIGNLIREHFLVVSHSDLSSRSFPDRTAVQGDDHKLEFMVPLVNDMVQSDPAKRPNIRDVVNRVEQLRRSLPWWKLRSRIRFKGQPLNSSFSETLEFLWTTMCRIFVRRSAIPRPPVHPMHTFKT